MRLMATCCPGLEFVLAQEILEKFGEKARSGRGKLFFDGEIADALSLRCADNLHLFIGEARAAANRPELPAMARALAELPLRDALGKADISADAIHLSASRSGRHSYSRFEAAAASLPAICAALGGEAGDAQRHTAALRLDIEGERARLYAKLTPPAFRFRGAREFSAAALRPTIAHALVRLTEPRAQDFFVDPFCGSGTILAERLCYPAACVAGGDIDPEAARIAQRNAPEATVRRWNATALPLDAASVDAVATNPPWGGQIAIADEGALYRGFLSQLKRVARPKARIVLLTDREEALASACASNGLHVDKLAAVSLHGTLAGVFRLGRE